MARVGLSMMRLLLATAALGGTATTLAFLFPSPAAQQQLRQVTAAPVWQQQQQQAQGLVAWREGARSGAGAALAATTAVRGAEEVLVPLEKSKALKVEFERLFAQAVRGPQSVSEADLTTLLEMAAEGRMWSRALQLLRLPGVSPTPEHYQLGLTACKRADGKWRAAVEVVSLMEERGVQNVAAYNEAMTICGFAFKSKEAVRILDRMGKAGVNAPLSSYNIAMSSLAREKQWRKAIKIVEYMQKQAVWPDVDTYTGAITACGGAGEWQRALILLEDMVKKGVAPEVSTYNAAMEACLLGKQGERAVAFLEEMVRKALPVDDESYAVAITACDVPGGKKMDKAIELWEGMGAVGVSPSGETYRALVKVLARKQLWAKAVDMLDTLEDLKATVPRGAAIKILAEEMDKAGAVVSELSKEVGEVMVTGLLQEGRSRDALALVKKGIAVDESNTNDHIEALQLLTVFQDKVTIKATAATSGGDGGGEEEEGQGGAGGLRIGDLAGTDDPEAQKIRALCEEGRVRDAVDALSKLASAGGAAAATKTAKQQAPLKPSLVKLVMEYCVRSRDPQAATRLLALPGVGASRATYNRALRVSAAAGDWPGVGALVREMVEDKGMSPDAGTFLELMEGSWERRDLTRVQRYARQLKEAGLSLSDAHVACLMRTYNHFSKYGLTLATYRDYLARSDSSKKEGGEETEDGSITRLALEAAALGGLADDALEIESRLVGGSGSSSSWWESLVLEALARAGRVEEVEKRATTGTTAQLNALLLAYKEQGRGADALSLVQEMGAKADGTSRARAVEALCTKADTLPEGVKQLLLLAQAAAANNKEAVGLGSAQLAQVFDACLAALARGPPSSSALDLLASLATVPLAPTDSMLLNAYKCLTQQQQGGAVPLERLRALAAQE